MSDENKVVAAENAQLFDRKQLIKLVVEFGPLLVFFVANSRYGIYTGTGAFMVATVVSLIASRTLLGRIAVMPLITSVFVLVFGGLTLWLQDDHFIKIKPTMVNGLFAAILFVGLATGRLFLKIVFGEVMRLTDQGWRILTFRWAFFFVFLAGLNEVMWRFFSTDTWVAFKVFGIMPITFIFALCQIGILKKYEDTTSEST
ncbi:putative intracellular septation protein (ispA/ispZ family), putative membrane protein [Hyphomicrobium sp. GJ21]|jgi:intracellular septation protein|uniref:septation protein A n=1 Tax=Hyphomicrobium sp. GJ21 TaxID=113574 RepID=UPI000622B5EB|nr:septation protein A [Hyphomicrobium sp. GJ21]MBN9290909.1 septation protein A [Hyphomicrobium denitrificans]CEJ83389.1 putative intracellular septation protein (ispA/ispZ family), putative membrane protein [Hyphomicrobium sp. GJ21]